VEIVVWAALAIAVVAILGHFLLRSGGGELVLPRIVDESIGMWILRKVTGRRLWEREPEEADDEASAGVPVMAAPAATRPPSGQTEPPIRILTLPPATLPPMTVPPAPPAPPTATTVTGSPRPVPVPVTAGIDLLARRARPAVLPTRYTAQGAEAADQAADAVPHPPVEASR
jgi:hypothetical protein